MNNKSSNNLAQKFNDLCQSRKLVVPNAWDGASAAVVTRAGAQAVATTSAGIAWAAGTSDGGGLDRDQAISAIRAVTAGTILPVSADIEHGYGETPKDLAESIELFLEAGVAGINIEDSLAGGLRRAEEQAERISLIRATAERNGVQLFINARVDTYFFGPADVEERFTQTIERSLAYVEAGADGIFVPGLGDAATISRLVSAVSVPVNIMVGPGSLSVNELLELGVGRVSLGMAGALGAYGFFEESAREMLGTGSYESLAKIPDFGEFNAMMTN